MGPVIMQYQVVTLPILTLDSYTHTGLSPNVCNLGGLIYVGGGGVKPSKLPGCLLAVKSINGLTIEFCGHLINS